MGPQLNKMGKFPLVLPDETPLADVVEEQLRTARIRMLRYRPDLAGDCSPHLLSLSLSFAAWMWLTP
jgi:hypothetical protein